MPLRRLDNIYTKNAVICKTIRKLTMSTGEDLEIGVLYESILFA